DSCLGPHELVGYEAILAFAFRRACRLTLPSSGRSPSGFACWKPPLTSNVRAQHMMGFQVRAAEPGDADAIVHVFKRSIRELCVADHRDDPAILEWWLSNKTAKNILAWMSAEDNYTIVAEDHSKVCGVAFLNRSGEIRACYLVPEMKGRGV